MMDFESALRQHQCQLTQVVLQWSTQALIWGGSASLSVCCLQADRAKRVFVYGASVSSHFSPPVQNRGLFMVVCRGRQKVGPHTRPAVCRRLLEMEGLGRAGPGCRLAAAQIHWKKDWAGKFWREDGVRGTSQPYQVPGPPFIATERSFKQEQSHSFHQILPDFWFFPH